MFTWLSAGSLPLAGGGLAKFVVPWGFQLDPLSAVMILVVTGVGFLIHIYSTGYMWEDTGYYRFFSYLNLFMFAMLTLVLANNFVLMFVGWEGVGLCSYLLIGFYFDKKSAGDAGKKAFVVNRIGDAGFHPGNDADICSFRLAAFRGGVPERSALPVQGRHMDSCSGRPFASLSEQRGRARRFLSTCGCRTPWKVLRRCRPDSRGNDGDGRRLYGLPVQRAVQPGSRRRWRSWPSWGRLTAVFAATIGFAQTDIKRVLAYSTVSQLGYMFAALGVGAFVGGIFHLMTHAFFKALLFLGSGSVIMAMHHEQDMMKMGGLRKYLPWTYWTMLVGDAGHQRDFQDSPDSSAKTRSSGARGATATHGVVPSLVCAGMTAFYMFRLLFLTFWGQERMDDHTKHHIRESPRRRGLSAGGSGGAFGHWRLCGIARHGAGSEQVRAFLEPVLRLPAQAQDGRATLRDQEYTSLPLSVAIAGAGILSGVSILCGPGPEAADRFAESFKGLYRLVYRQVLH